METSRTLEEKHKRGITDITTGAIPTDGPPGDRAMNLCRGCIVAVTMLFWLVGCASTHSVDVRYYNLSPTTVGASVITESRNATGINQSCIDTWTIDKTGKCSHIGQASSSAQGELPSFVQGIAGNAAANTVAGAVIGVVK